MLAYTLMENVVPGIGKGPECRRYMGTDSLAFGAGSIQCGRETAGSYSMWKDNAALRMSV